MNTDEHGFKKNAFLRSVFIGVHLWLFFFSSTSSAHPLPNLRFDRSVDVRLSPDAVAVRYTLELNDWTMVLDGKDLVTPADVNQNPGQLGYARAYAAKKAPLIADDLRATLDGADVPFRADGVAVEPEQDHVRLKLTFRAVWSPEPGKPHTFAFEAQNFEGRAGAVSLTLDKLGDGIELTAVNQPIALRGKSPLDLTPDEAARLRKASATFVVGRVESPLSEVSPVSGVSDSPPPSEAVHHSFGNVATLFDTGYGLGVLLLLAFGFGAAHAFTPGHGKTLVAAYLVGERGTVRHAVVLGLVTTLAHTGSVIVVAVVLRGFYGDAVPATTEAVLKTLGGLLIFGVGLWLFLRRVGGRADHVHLHGGNSMRPGVIRLVMLGLGGGLIPCWDAVLLLLVAASAGRLGAAIPLLLAFSAGLASVLVALGIGVVFAFRRGGRSFGDARWFRMLPTVSAALLVGLGVWFVRDGARALLGL